MASGAGIHEMPNVVEAHRVRGLPADIADGRS